jgi:protein phosphatase
MNEDPKEKRRALVSQALDIAPFHPLSSAVGLELGAASICGKGHSHNTDHYLVIRLGRSQETLMTSLSAADLPSHFEESGYILFVADGLGEDGTGARASRVALSTLAHLAIRYGKWNIRVDPEAPTEIMEQGEFLYRRANDAVYQASRANLALAGIATSLTALYIAEDNLFFARAGSSSAFLLRNGVLIQLTINGALEQELHGPDRPALERATRDLRHKLARMIGGGPTAPNVEIEHIKLSSSDRLLLCTNGLTDVVTEDQIADALAGHRRPREDCLRLIDLALAAGGSDDVTVMLADYTLRTDLPQSEP